MVDILIVAEHREGRIREVTYEVIRKARELNGSQVSVALLGHQVTPLAEELSTRKVDEVLVAEDPRLANYNCDGYQNTLSSLIEERRPDLTLIGHTACGMDYAPSLAAQVDLALVTDCIDLRIEGKEVVATRQMYNGRVEVEVRFTGANQSIATMRPAMLEPIEVDKTKKAKIIKIESKLKDLRSSFLDYIRPVEEEIDITKAEVIVSVGRGIGGKENIPMVENLAKVLGGVLGCSRPVIDKGWLPKVRQIGSSGKVVKPKLYLAVGISGATQHVMGMKGSGLIVAVNKDPNAPIFNIADYGVVGDLFKVIPLLTEELKK